ncbi:amino acid permease-domain-containing protein [Hyaloscypha sp. PMI_1271]|nr:amino acid permease-domain-containing protein [Hyaloscypha sp. PMI_1271]
MQFIAFGGAIGTGLFIGCGQALAAGGPGSLLLGFLTIGLDLLCTIYSLAEMTLVFPISGAFVVHATRLINKSWGVAMGWNYGVLVDPYCHLSYPRLFKLSLL